MNIFSILRIAEKSSVVVTYENVAAAVDYTAADFAGKLLGGENIRLSSECKAETEQEFI